MPERHKLLDQTLASETVAKFAKKTKDGNTSIAEILSEFHENSFAIIMIFFSLPIAIPLPYPPGFTTLFGIPLILLSLQMILGFESVKFPQALAQKQINNSTLIMMSEKFTPILVTLEKYLKKRYEFASSVLAERIVGIVSLICAISIAIPLPLTNSIPAWGITIMSLGLLRRDGLVLGAGFLVSVIGNVIAFFAVLGAGKLANFLFNYIF